MILDLKRSSRKVKYDTAAAIAQGVTPQYENFGSAPPFRSLSTSSPSAALAFTFLVPEVEEMP
jgi:hypothetical protein